MNHTFAIKGMSCQNCVKHATETLMALPGASNVLVTLNPPQGTLDHDGSISFTAIAEALKEEGYEASPLA